MAEINQDLLLAALARLTGTIPEDVLQPALARWSRDPVRPLADHLGDSGRLDPLQIGALRVLASAHLVKHQGNLRKSLDEWNATAITQDWLTEVDTQGQGSTLAATLGPTLGPGAAADGPEGDEEADLPNFTQGERFRLIRKHAKGGIGEVWLAEDRELQRQVAVKEIQAQYVDRKDQRKRFLLEAEVTGSLEHPGIVPVYSLGRNDQGRPFYAMRFIRGESLRDAIRRFHEGRRKAAEGDSLGVSPWGVEFQQLLRRFLDVCDAMEYAHSRGVIHRDLKPANIMLGEYGETLVVDWGLAKVVGKRDIAAEPMADDGAEEPVPTPQGATGHLDGETQPGSTIGTPSYMSPEQARGDLDDLGPVSDVYSLGATLYELLTGIVPFAAEQMIEILARVKKGALIPPRSIVPELPAALEAICLKAMAFDPAQRYSSARELALDLEHWMADEPVSAYPERRLQRVSRWLRRHRSWTYAGAAALVGITLVTAVALFLVDRSRRSEEDAHNQAERNFKMAQSAVDKFLTRVSESPLLKEQERADLHELRKQLLLSALPFYEAFVEVSKDDPAAREQLANAYFRLGAITEEVGATAEAIRLYKASVGLWKPLVASRPENVDFRRREADCDFAIGRLTRDQVPEEAKGWLERALEIYLSLSRGKPLEASLQAAVANCYSELGLCHSYENDVKKALEVLGRGREVQEKLVAGDPKDVELRKDLAEIVNRMGFVAYVQKDFDDALRIYQGFQEICLDILRSVNPYGPRPLKILESLARSYYNIGTMRLEKDEFPAAMEAFLKAEETYETLVRDQSSVYRYQRGLGQTFLSIATTHFRLEQLDQAMKAINKASILFDRLIGAEPKNLTYQRDKAMLLDLTGAVLDAERKSDLAAGYFQESLDLRREILRKGGGVDTDKELLCVSLTNLGENSLDLGDIAKGLPLYLEALGYRRELALSNPDDRARTRELLELSLLVGEIQAQAGQPDAALLTYRDASEFLGTALGRHGEDEALRTLLPRVRLGEALVQPATQDRAVDLLKEAVDLDRNLLRGSEKDPARRGQLTEALWELAATLRGKGAAGDADRLDAERRSLWQGRPAEPLLTLASQEAARAHLVGYGKTPLPPTGEAARRHAQDRAAATLRMAIDMGFKDRTRIKADPELAPLLERDDVRASLDAAARSEKRPGPR